MRKTLFTEGEFYHIYNRGTDKRNITSCKEDLLRILQSMKEFNTENPIGSIYENTFNEDKKRPKKPLVNFICYCINPNHYHFLLQQTVEKGIEKFMHRFATGYTKYFNQKYHRSGGLFQGPYKAIHVASNEYLLRLSAYINFNNHVHKLGSLASKLVASSWYEYKKENATNPMCKKNIILQQFSSKKEYQRFSKESLQDTLRHKDMDRELQVIFLENLEA